MTLPNRSDLDAARATDTVDAQVREAMREVARKMRQWWDPGAETWERVTVGSPPIAELLMLDIMAAGYACDYHWHGTRERPIVQFSRSPEQLRYPHGKDERCSDWRPDPPPDMLSVFGGGAL